MIQALQKQRDPEEGRQREFKRPSDNPESASLLPLSSQTTTTVTQGPEKKVVVVSAESEKPVNAFSVGGFRFSGDFRFRLDMQARSGNEIAAPLQNIRSRYRVRLNVDKEIDPHLNFHLQLSTGPYNVGTTNDQDFAGTIAKHPFSVAEAYIDFHPNSKIAVRGGRMEEVFADTMRFIWDDDVRFNGFQQIVKLPINSD